MAFLAAGEKKKSLNIHALVQEERLEGEALAADRVFRVRAGRRPANLDDRRERPCVASSGDMALGPGQPAGLACCKLQGRGGEGMVRFCSFPFSGTLVTPVLSPLYFRNRTEFPHAIL